MTVVDRLSGVRGTLAYKAPVRAATTANIALTGEQTIDGVAVVDGDRVLVKDQTSGAENGIYVASTGVWARAKDFDGTGDVAQGSQVFVTAGASSATVPYRITTPDPIIIGTSAIAFTQGFIDDDTFATASPVTVASSESVKAYVDAVATAADLDFAGDSGGALAIDLDAEVLTLAGGSGIVTSGAGNTLTTDLDINSLTPATIADEDFVPFWDITATATNKKSTWADVQATITATGTLNAGSISTGFGDIDVGTSDITTGGQVIIDADGSGINAAGSIRFGALGTGDAAIYFNGTTLEIDSSTSIDFSQGGVTIGDIGATGMNVVPGSAYKVGGTTVLASGALTLGPSGTVSAASGNLAIASGWTAASQTCADLGTVTTADIDGGTLDGVVIGAAAPAAASFTTLALGGDVTRAGDQTIDLSGAATRTLTLQNSTAAQVADFDTDGVLKFRNGTPFTLTLSGTPAANRTITFPDTTDTVVTLAAAQTLANKTLTAPAISTSIALPADAVDAITEIASALKSGADATLVTGTAGVSGNASVWNADGDLVDGGFDATNLSALNGLSLIADRLPYANGTGALALTTFTAAGRALVDDADAAAQRTTLGLVIGTDVETKGQLAAIETDTGTNRTLVMGDAGDTIEMNNAAANTLTVPPNASVAFPVKTYINVVQLGAGATTITPGSGVTIRNRNGLVLGGQYALATLYKRGTDEWVAGGDLVL